MKPRYFKGNNLYMPDPYWWVDPMIVAGIFAIDISILAITMFHLVRL